MHCIDAAYCYRCRTSACLLDMRKSLAKTAEPIEMLYDVLTLANPRNHALDGGLDFPTGRINYEGCPTAPFPTGVHCPREIFRPAMWPFVEIL